MKGKKLVFAVILSLIVCLLLLPTCAYASDVDSDVYNSGNAVDPVPPDGDAPAAPDAPDADDTPDIPAGDDEGKETPPADKIPTPDLVEGDSEKESAPADDADDTDDEQGDTPAADLDDETDKDKPAADLDDETDEDKPAADLDDETDEDKPAADLDDEDDKDKSAADLDDETDKDEPAADLNDETDEDESAADPGSTPPEKTGFQVELTYNGKMVKLSGLKGGESHDLAALLHELGIDGELTEATGNADELFNVTRDESGMRFNTLMAFGDPYQLVVTVDGVQYIIDVTDDGNTILADGTKTLQELIDGAAKGQTIVLTTDYQESIKIGSDKNITIDLNGCKLKNNGSHTIRNDGTLTLNDTKGGAVVSVVNGDARLAVLFNYGTLTVNAGTYQRKDWYCVKNFGDMTINGGDFPKGSSGNSLIVNGWYSKNNENAWNNDFGYKYTGKDATMTINGGDYTGSVKNDFHATLVINEGSELKAGLQNNGDATINGGSISGNNWVIAPTDSDSVTTINGGSFNSKNSFIHSSDDSAVEGKMNIGNGTFNAGIHKPTKLNMTITGGEYTDKNIEKYVDDDEVVVKSGNMYAVNESAYELAKNGEPVEIVKAPANANIDNVPAGITVVNNSGTTLVINGVEVKNGETIVTVKSVAAPAAATVDAPVVKYWVVEGVNPEWTKGNTDSLKFVLNSSAVVKVLVDGVEVDFELDENGEVIISAEVLEKLDAGEYEIEFVFADGSCKTKLFVK